MKAVKHCLPSLVLSLALALPVLALEPWEQPDLKPLAIRAYGVREAWTTDATHVRVAIGSSCTPAAENPDAWRIVSQGDPAYAFDKFVRPTAVKRISKETEFALPANPGLPKGGDILELRRTEVELTLPSPWLGSANYWVVAQGSGDHMVTGANTAHMVFTNKLVGDYHEPETSKQLAARAVGLRAVRSVGNGILLAEFGAGYAPAYGMDPAAFSVTVNGSPATVRSVGRRTKIDVYHPDGWPYKGYLQHELFLDIGRALAEGDKVRVEIAEGAVATGANRGAELSFSTQTSFSDALQANQIGYLPDTLKAAYLGRWLGSGGALSFDTPPAFELRDAMTHAVVHRGTAKLVVKAEDNDGKSNHSGSNVYELDFTAFQTPGRYYLAVAGVGRSLPFAIGADSYSSAFQVAATGLYEQRCGIELGPPYTPWRRIACHTNGVTAVLTVPWGHRWPDPKEVEKNADGSPLVFRASGGHHDAGDYNPRSHIDIAQALLWAYDLAPQKFGDGQTNIPEQKNGIPDIVDEALWALTLWHGLYDPATGAVRDGTESAKDPGFFQTVDLDDTGDYAWAATARGSLLYAGALAQAARILAPFDAKQSAEFLARARKAYAWGKEHKPPLQKEGELSEHYGAPLAYAAVELYRATGETPFHEDFLAAVPWRANPKAELINYGKWNHSWAAYAYALVPNTMADAAMKAAAIDAIKREADMYIWGSKQMGYKFIRHPYAPINWGTGAYENYAKPVATMWALTGETTYRDWLVRTCDNTLGANPMCLSYITGLGPRRVHMPLHNSRYSPLGKAAPGQQVEGPVAAGGGYNVKDTLFPAHDPKRAVLHTFVDCCFAIGMDEGLSNSQANTMAVFGLLLPDRK